QVEPDPPDSNLGYSDVDRLLVELADVWPDANQALSRIIYQPGAQVEIVLDSWNRREFDVARRGLRRVLLWDPDRWRVLQANEAIKRTPDWLEKIESGPLDADKLSEYATHLELQGRELRNRVGRAGWLDLILAALKQFRQGTDPATVIKNQPELMNAFPWLKYYMKEPYIEEFPKEPAVDVDPEIQFTESFVIGRVENERNNDYITQGMINAKFGSDQSIILTDALDTWTPAAQGSSARVFQGFIRTNNTRLKQAAIKIMRPDKIEYALPLFREEANILVRLQDVPGITRMIECGFFELDVDGNTRSVEVLNNIRSITGNVTRYGIDEIDRFLSDLDEKTEERFLPYLAFEKRNNETNLLTLCDAGHTQGKYLPVELGLIISMQICDIIKVAHERDIVYRDHKILHYYWRKIFNGVFVIDWNVAKWYPSGLTEAERQFDIVQFGARALHHILTGRPAPGALPIGPTSPEEIEHASHQYSVLWTFDDQRLPQAVRGLLERVLAGEFSEMETLKDALKQSLIITVKDESRLI
ncbi:MAG: hypothetical protein MUO76_01220, partial [Anaerolineaceae bacterium]|nr:hypothetical protein [Anaerolineaceae bacterium]